MKYLFIIGLICIHTFCKAQINSETKNPVTWKISIHAMQRPNEYMIEAIATIQKGWHLFSKDPGGDGLLIPTTLTIDEKKLTKVTAAHLQFKVSETIEEGKLLKQKLEGFGELNLYENELILTAIVTTIKKIPITGMVEYQTCNDSMCLPPTQVPFAFKPTDY